MPTVATQTVKTTADRNLDDVSLIAAVLGEKLPPFESLLGNRWMSARAGTLFQLMAILAIRKLELAGERQRASIIRQTAPYHYLLLVGWFTCNLRNPMEQAAQPNKKQSVNMIWEANRAIVEHYSAASAGTPDGMAVLQVLDTAAQFVLRHPELEKVIIGVDKKSMDEDPREIYKKYVVFSSKAKVGGAQMIPGCLMMLGTIVLVPVKLWGAVNWSWWWVFSPLWGGMLATIIVGALLAIFKKGKGKK